MGISNELLYKLCHCLAFHAVETEITSRFVEPGSAAEALKKKYAEARFLLACAGHDMDQIYPAHERPIVTENPPKASKPKWATWLSSPFAGGPGAYPDRP